MAGESPPPPSPGSKGWRRCRPAGCGGSGFVLERFELAPGADVRDLALVPAPVDETAPELEILSPEPDEEVSPTPAIAVAYADPGSGVRPQTLAFEVDGQAAAASCSYAVDGATCELAEPLAEGEVVLTATVEDELRNVSAPATARFQVASSDDDDSDDTDDPSGGAAPTYTPVVSPRGIRPHTTFTSASDIEAIDTASGSLTLSVPLGQAYEVGPILRYQLRAVYNSRVWEHMQVNCDLQDGGQCGAGDYPSVGESASKGRVVEVRNPLYQTSYGYDPYDRRVAATRFKEAFSQERAYGYDARGLLVSETHPELGVSGNGSVSYQPDTSVVR